MARLQEQREEPVWYVHVQGRVWGPYAEPRLEAFVEEGRVGANALVADNPNGPFGPAGAEARLGCLFAKPEPKPAAPAYGAPVYEEPQTYEEPQVYESQGYVTEAYASGSTAAQPRAQPHAPSSRYDAPAEPAGHARPLLVFASLGTLEDSVFESALAMHGPYELIGRGLWLVRARLGPAALRNALSRRLRGEDALLVVEAGLAQAAWFNLDQVEEAKLRSLWAD